MELYCSQHQIDPKDFPKVVFRQALYPHTRPFVTLIAVFQRYHFAADHAFIDSISRIKRYQNFRSCAEELARHPLNRGFLRHGLRLRLSSNRLRTIIKTVMPKKDEMDL